MKTAEEIALTEKVSVQVIWKRVNRIDSSKPEDYLYKFQKINGKYKRAFNDDEVLQVQNEGKRTGRPKKVYREE